MYTPKSRFIAALVPALLMVLHVAAAAAGFHAVFSEDGIGVWAVGDAGTIYRSYDAGASWVSFTLGTDVLRDVAGVGLTAVAVSDNGKVWNTTDAGGNWSSTNVSGSPDMYAVAMPSASVAYVAGGSGKIMKSVNGGATWSTQTSGTGATLRALYFTNETDGWAVGDGGVVLRTTNGGSNWTTKSIGATHTLLDVAQYGNTVWAVGERACAYQSTNGGNNWNGVQLEIDDPIDVSAVVLKSETHVILGGGGGFIRESTDGGSNWTFFEHDLHARLTGLAAVGSGMWAVNADNRAVMRTTNGGSSWGYASGTSIFGGWTQKLGTLPYPAGVTVIGVVRGGTIQNHPTNPHAFYCAIGHQVFASYDDGETWILKARILGVGVSAHTNAFVMSPKDTNLWVAACKDSNSSARILRTTNGGTSWTNTPCGNLIGGSSGPTDFGQYGIPLQVHPDKPDTIYFGGDNYKLLRSTNFGSTWATLNTMGPTANKFRSPCNITIVPGLNGVMYVGDGITGSGIGEIWKSTDGGDSWNLVLTHSMSNSEIPGMATSRLSKNRAYATAWSAPGGLWRTTNTGSNWTNQSVEDRTWGVDVAKDDPNVLMFGVYTGNLTYLSRDGGDSFVTDNLNNSNYTFYLRDRATMLAEQSTGIFKMNITYNYTPGSGTQSVTVLSPNGGESWGGGTTQSVTWTSTNIAAARIEYRTGPSDPWTLVADVPGYLGTYSWTVPMVSTTQAQVRVSDLWNGSPVDASNGNFTITGGASPMVELLAPDGGESWQYNTAHDIEWNASLVSNVDIDYKTSAAGSWNPIATNYPAAGGSYAWVMPNDPTADAYVRVRESGGGLVDESAAPFAITVPSCTVDPPVLDMGGALLNQQIGDVVTIDNPGTAPLTISAVVDDDSHFWAGRSSFVIPPGGSDTLGIWFQRADASPDTAIFTMTGDHPGSPTQFSVIAYAVTSLAAGDARVTSFALWQNQPNPFTGLTNIRYALPVESSVSLEVFDVQGHRVATLARGTQAAGEYSVRFGRGVVDADGRPLSALRAGVYFVHYQAGTYQATRKMLLMR